MATETKAEKRVAAILSKVKPLAAEFYKLTGKPLGVTGEVAEYIAAKTLGLRLAVARTSGYDALRGDGERIQIKGRAFNPKLKRAQRMSKIKLDAACDTVMLVLLDNATLDLVEIWEAPYVKVAALLTATDSKALARGQLNVSTFKRAGKMVWPS